MNTCTKEADTRPGHDVYGEVIGDAGHSVGDQDAGHGEGEHRPPAHHVGQLAQEEGTHHHTGHEGGHGALQVCCHVQYSCHGSTFDVQLLISVGLNLSKILGSQVKSSPTPISVSISLSVFFSRPSPKVGRELHIDRIRDEDEGGPIAKNQPEPVPGRESTQRLCTC